MKKITFLFLLLGGFAIQLSAQKYFVRDGKISFYSDTPLEKIEAHNQNATSVIDAESGKMEFAVLIKAFQFEKALMQEHFNENYMESSQFPKAKFKGQITNLSNVNFGIDGTYTADIAGVLTIHGVSNSIETKGTFIVVNGQLSAQADLTVLVADYGIKIPAVVRENIAKEVKIVIDIKNYQVLDQ